MDQDQVLAVLTQQHEERTEKCNDLIEAIKGLTEAIKDHQVQIHDATTEIVAAARSLRKSP